MKRLSATVLMLALLVLCATAVSAEVFPTLDYEGFDVGTYTYTYRVTCPNDSTFPFGQLIIQAEVPNDGIYAVWQLDADTAPATNWDMYTQVRVWGPERKDNAIWRAAILDDVIAAETYWTGRFILVVPNSTPVDGIGVTMDGGPASGNSTTVYVPGPAPIPEPSSLLALGALAGGILPLIRRRR